MQTKPNQTITEANRALPHAAPNNNKRKQHQKNHRKQKQKTRGKKKKPTKKTQKPTNSQPNTMKRQTTTNTYFYFIFGNSSHMKSLEFISLGNYYLIIETRHFVPRQIVHCRILRWILLAYMCWFWYTEGFGENKRN